LENDESAAEIASPSKITRVFHEHRIGAMLIRPEEEGSRMTLAGDASREKHHQAKEGLT